MNVQKKILVLPIQNSQLPHTSTKIRQFINFKTIAILVVIVSINGCGQNTDSSVYDNVKTNVSEHVNEMSTEVEAKFENSIDDISSQANINTDLVHQQETKPKTVLASKPSQSVQQPVKRRRMIWKANLEFQVENMETASKRISSICEREGAFISGMDMSSSNYKIHNQVHIRVSNDRFHQLIDQLKGESIYTDYINITSNDVTEEFIDIESRLKTKKEVRDRYINILRKKTGSIKEVIEAEEAIRRITEEIEAKEGRLRFLKDQVNYSTISVNIYQKVEFNRAPEVYEKSFKDEISDSFSNGWRFLTVVFLIFVNLWPLLLAAIIFLVWWKYRRKRNVKQ